MKWPPRRRRHRHRAALRPRRRGRSRRSGCGRAACSPSTSGDRGGRPAPRHRPARRTPRTAPGSALRGAAARQYHDGVAPPRAISASRAPATVAASAVRRPRGVPSASRSGEVAHLDLHASSPRRRGNRRGRLWRWPGRVVDHAIAPTAEVSTPELWLGTAPARRPRCGARAGTRGACRARPVEVGAWRPRAGAGRRPCCKPSSAGRTSSRKVTKLDTGLPGRPMNQAAAVGAWRLAEGERLAGLHRHLPSSPAPRPDGRV